jgi:hypothetical protein
MNTMLSHPDSIPEEPSDDKIKEYMVGFGECGGTDYVPALARMFKANLPKKDKSYIFITLD